MAFVIEKVIKPHAETIARLASSGAIVAVVFEPPPVARQDQIGRAHV
jgi:hypothetical protein